MPRLVVQLGQGGVVQRFERPHLDRIGRGPPNTPDETFEQDRRQYIAVSSHDVLPVLAGVTRDRSLHAGSTLSNIPSERGGSVAVRCPAENHHRSHLVAVDESLCSLGRGPLVCREGLGMPACLDHEVTRS